MDRDDKILDYVQGTMNAQDRAAFDAVIAEDQTLAAEISALTNARAVMEPDGVPDKNAGWARLSAAIDTERYQPANDNRPAFLSLVQVACVAIASVLVWQFAVMPLTSSSTAVYAPASEAADGPGLQVVFNGTASVGDVSELLNAVDATIVSGPGSLGLYRVTFADEATRQAAFETLSNRSDLVAEILNE